MMDRGLRMILGVLAVAVITVLSVATVCAQPTPLTYRAPSVADGQDDVAWWASTRSRQSLWLLSTRRLLPASPDAIPVSFVPDVWRFETSRGWVTSSLDELLQAGSQSTTTSLFIHGNDTNAQDAAEGGAALYRQLLADVRPSDTTQFVIWSWPSYVSGARVRESAQANALRTNFEGYYLANYLSRVTSDVPIRISGYCSGARIATGGLHLLGGGTLAGLRMAKPNRSPPRSVHAVLVAAGLANDWILPGQPHGLALSQVDRLVITVNSVDPVLRWHPWIWGRGGPPALGTTGLSEPWKLGAAQAKIVQLNFEPILQRRHSWKYYRSSPHIIALLQNEMLSTRALRDR